MASIDSSFKKRKSSEDPARNGKRSRVDGLTGSPLSRGTPKRLAEWVKARAASNLAQQTPTKSGIVAASPIRASAIKNSGLAGETPQKLRQTVSRLPSSYALLVEFFGKLQTVYLLSRQRQQQCTFQAVKRPMEEAAGRTFTVQHLLQLKEAFPDAFKLTTYNQASGQPGGSGAKVGEQILIEMPLLRAAHTPAARQDLRQQLADALFQRVKVHYDATFPSGGGDPEDPSAWNPAFDLESVPPVPAAALPTAANGSPSTPQSRAGLPRSSRLTGKKLTFAGGPAGGSGDGFFLEDPSPANDALDRQMRRQSMDGTLPVSLAALQAVRRNQLAKTAAESVEATAARSRAAAMAQLPRAFDAVRAVFGANGPTALPVSQVLSRLEGAWGGGGGQDLPKLLDMLVEALPQWLSRSIRPDQGPMLRVVRKLDPGQLREKLTEFQRASSDEGLSSLD